MRTWTPWMALLVAGSRLARAIKPTYEESFPPHMKVGETTQLGSHIWVLTWSEEFDGNAGDPPDPEVWTAKIGGGGWGNNELECYTDHNAALDGQGNLVIMAKQEQVPDYPNCTNLQYTSSRLQTYGKFDLMYGRVEARLKVPSGNGFWPAFWMLGDDINTGTSWPNCGEIDIMETVNKDPTWIQSSLHGPGYSGGASLHKQIQTQDGKPFSDDFHLYGVTWEWDHFKFYMDGKFFFNLTIDEIPKGTKWVYDHEFFILLNFAIGGTWPGAPTKSTVFPASYSVDFVRVYEYINTTSTAAAARARHFPKKHMDDGAKKPHEGHHMDFADTRTGPKHMGPAPAFP